MGLFASNQCSAPYIHHVHCRCASRDASARLTSRARDLRLTLYAEMRIHQPRMRVRELNTCAATHASNCKRCSPHVSIGLRYSGDSAQEMLAAIEHYNGDYDGADICPNRCADRLILNIRNTTAQTSALADALTVLSMHKGCSLHASILPRPQTTRLLY